MGSQLNDELLQHAFEGNLIGVKSLLKTSNADVDINCVDSLNRTPLNKACINNHASVVAYLLHKGADTTIANQAGWTPLHTASYRNALGCFVLLRHAKADPQAKALDGKACRDVAKINRSHQIVALIDKSPTVGTWDKAHTYFPHGEVMQAVTDGSLAKMREFLLNGVDVNFDHTPRSVRADKGGAATLLIEAVRRVNLSMIRFLAVEAGALLDTQDKNGYTALHWACRAHNRNVAQRLIELGADTLITSKDGNTPLALAQQENATDIVELLKRSANTSSQPNAEAAGVRKFLKDGEGQPINKGTIVVGGEGRAGKSALGDSITNQKFNKNKKSTVGADSQQITASRAQGTEVRGWKATEEERGVELQRAIARGKIAANRAKDVNGEEQSNVPVKDARSFMSEATQKDAEAILEEEKNADEIETATEEQIALANASKKKSKAQPQKQTQVDEKKGKDKGKGKGKPSAKQVDSDDENDDGSESDDNGNDDKQDSSNSGEKPVEAKKPIRRVSRKVSTKPTNALHPLPDAPKEKPKPKRTKEGLESAIRELAGGDQVALDDDPDAITFRFFDLGGQSSFYSFHQMLMTRYAIYVVVFSMEQVTHKDVDTREQAWEFVRQWLDSIAINAQGTHILLVGTFGDVVKDHRKREKISIEIYNRFSEHECFHDVVQNKDEQTSLWFWPVDNTLAGKNPDEPADVGVQSLQRNITRISNELDHVKMQVPIGWLAFYDKLMSLYREEKRPFVTIDEATAIGFTFDMKDEEEVKHCLRLWHTYGMLMYYHTVPGMDNLIVLSSQWAVDVMSRVIRNFDLHGFFDTPLKRKKHKAHCSLLGKKSILSYDLAVALWEELSSDQVDAFLDLMADFGLIIPLFNEKKQANDHEFLVPGILPVSLTNPKLPRESLSNYVALSLNKYSAHDQAENHKAVYLLFSTQPRPRAASVDVTTLETSTFLPEGLFARIVCALVSSSDSAQRDNQKLSRTQAEMFIRGVIVNLDLVPSVGGIRLNIKCDKPRFLLRMIQDTVLEVLRSCYRAITCHAALPYTNNTLLYLDNVVVANDRKESLYVNSKVLSFEELGAMYSPWLPTVGLLPKYDVFVSYRQAANSSVVVKLHTELESSQQECFLDVRNLEPGLDFQMQFMDAMSKAIVVCPVMSATAIERMFEITPTNDYCDNVLLEWWCMLELLEYVGDHAGANIIDKKGKPVLLRRVTPLIMSEAWSNQNESRAKVGTDTFSDFQQKCNSLPNVLSEKTMKPLAEFLSNKFGTDIAPKQRSVRDIVTKLLAHDAIVCWDAGDADSAARGHSQAEANFKRAQKTNREEKVREYGKRVCEVVAIAERDIPDSIKESLRAETVAAAEVTSKSKAVGDVAGKHPREWSVADVQVWLSSVGLDTLCPIFEKGAINGLTFVKLQKSDLREENVSGVVIRSFLENRKSLMKVKTKACVIQ